MKILITVHQFFPAFSLGTERYTLALAQGLMNLGDEVVILTEDHGGGPDESGEPVREYRWDGVRVLAIPSVQSPIRRLAEYHSRPERIGIYEELIFRERPDIVHCCHIMRLGIEFLEICKSFGVPVTATLTDLWGICWAGQLVKPCDQTQCEGPRKDMSNCIQDYLLAKLPGGRFSNPMEMKLAKLRPAALQAAAIALAGSLPGRMREFHLHDISDLTCRNRRIREAFSIFREVIYPSRFLQEESEKHNLIPAGKGRLMPYGIRPPDEAERAALRAPKADATTTFAFIGQIARHKGLHLLVEAFSRLEGENARLIVYGKTNPGDPNAVALMESIENTPHAEYAGSFNGPEVYQVFRSVDAVVVPSIWHENAPLAMLEALTAGRPVLVSRARGMVDFVEEGRTGLIFDMNSVDALEQALRQFLRDGARMRASCIETPGFLWTPEDHARELRGMLASHQSEIRWPESLTRFSIHDIVAIQASTNQHYGENPDFAATCIIRTGIRGCQLRIPDANGLEIAATHVRTPDSPQSGGKPFEQGVGQTFPHLHPRECLVRTHSKPYLSLWGKGSRVMRLDKIPGIDRARSIRIEVKAKHAIRSRLKVIGRNAPEGGLRNPSHEWNWSTKHRSTITINLEYLRRKLRVIDAIEWTPVISRGLWKLDVFDFAISQDGDC